jgi:hypothetical protein
MPVGPLSPTRRLSRGPKFAGVRDGRAVEVGLLQYGTPLFTYSIGEDAPIHFRVSRKRLRVDVSLWLDVSAGEVIVQGFIDVRGFFRRRWRRIFERDGVSDNSVLARVDPCSGAISEKRLAPPPVFDRAPYGNVRPCSPAVLRIHVEEESRLACNVGHEVKRRLFPNYKDFIFNTVPCVGAPGPRNIGLYTDPLSWWFNLFIGYYQIDVVADEWERPFGYQKPENVDSQVRGEDLIRLGKADWNWFSNWMYGVPTEAIEPYMTVPDGATVDCLDNREIGMSEWHQVRLNNVRVASCYQSEAPGAARLVGRGPLGQVWRDSFGLPCPRPDRTESFFSTELCGHLYMAYSREPEGPGEGRNHRPAMFHTYMFGATVWWDDPLRDDDFKEDFLQAQLEAIRELMVGTYGARGFPIPREEEGPLVTSPPGFGS